MNHRRLDVIETLQDDLETRVRGATALAARSVVGKSARVAARAVTLGEGVALTRRTARRRTRIRRVRVVRESARIAVAAVAVSEGVTDARAAAAAAAAGTLVVRAGVRKLAAVAAIALTAVSYTHLTLPTKA